MTVHELLRKNAAMQLHRLQEPFGVIADLPSAELLAHALASLLYCPLR